MAGRKRSPRPVGSKAADDRDDFDKEALPRFPVGCTPLEQAMLWNPLTPYPWQADILKALAEPYSRVAVSTNNESGKTSYIIPVFLLSVMAAFPGAGCFAMSGSERQLKEQLFKGTLLPIVNRWPNKFQVSHSDLKITHANGSTLLCYCTNDPNKVEGFHSQWSVDPATGKKRFRPCAYALDECKTIRDEVEQQVFRIRPYFLFATSSPDQARGWFYNAIDPDTLRT